MKIIAENGAACVSLDEKAAAGFSNRGTRGEPTKSSSGWIYFVQSHSGGPVKIGFASNVRARLGELQVGSPVRLRVLGKCSGTIEDERKLHQELKGHKVHGEWFWPDGEVQAAIGRCLGRVPRHLARNKYAKISEIPLSRIVQAKACLWCKDDMRPTVAGLCHECALGVVLLHEKKARAARAQAKEIAS